MDFLIRLKMRELNKIRQYPAMVAEWSKPSVKSFRRAIDRELESPLGISTGLLSPFQSFIVLKNTNNNKKNIIYRGSTSV